MQDQSANIFFISVLVKRRDMLEADHVAGNCGKVLVPEPFGCLIGPGYAAGFAWSKTLLLFLSAEARQLFSLDHRQLASRERRQTSEMDSMRKAYIARTNDQHVTRLEFNTLLFGNGLNVLYRDLMALEGTILDSLFIDPKFVVDEDATSD